MLVPLKIAAALGCCAALAAGIALVTDAMAQSGTGGQAPANSGSGANSPSPIYGVTIPAGYRDWQLVSVAHIPDAGPNRLKAILGNPIAIKAFREGKLPFPDGAILAKLEWHTAQHPDQNNRVLGEPNAFIPGDPLEVGFMVKDAKKYPSTGGWGYGEFVAGKPLDKAKHEACAACHAAGATSKQDFVFTRYAPD